MSKTLFIIGAFVLLFVAVTYFYNRSIRKRLIEIDKDRPKLDKIGFVKLLQQKGYEEKHAAVVHDKIMNYLSMNEFSIYPTDDLHLDYKIGDLDDVDIIDQVCRELDIDRPSQADFDNLSRTFDYLSVESILHLTKKLAG